MHKKFRVKTNGRIQAIIENRAKDAIVKSKSKTFASRAEAEAWAANMFVVDTPFQTLTKLKQIIGEEQYKEAKYDFID